LKKELISETLSWFLFLRKLLVISALIHWIIFVFGIFIICEIVNKRSSLFLELWISLKKQVSRLKPRLFIWWEAIILFEKNGCLVRTLYEKFSHCEIYIIWMRVLTVDLQLLTCLFKFYLVDFVFRRLLKRWVSEKKSSIFFTVFFLLLSY